MNPSPTAIVVIGHGTTDPQGVNQFIELVGTLQSRDPLRKYYASFMELAEPNMDDAIARAVRDGHQEVLCQPALLLTAGHAKNDLPARIREIAAHHHGVNLRYGSPMELSAEIVALCAQQVRAAAPGLDFSNCTLLVVGRGTSDPDANSNVSKLARMLEEGLGFSESNVCYFSTTQPRLPRGLERVASRAEGPIVVFPFILFSGVLHEMLNDELRRVQALFPAARLLRANPFGSASDFADAFLLRIQAAIDGNGELPCLLCKFRSALPGREHEVGTPQPSDHHHHHHHDGACGHTHHH
jgi:precorrin-8X/cobalt-precorrin-8 methylmutase